MGALGCSGFASRAGGSPRPPRLCTPLTPSPAVLSASPQAGQPHDSPEGSRGPSAAVQGLEQAPRLGAAGGQRPYPRLAVLLSGSRFLFLRQPLLTPQPSPWEPASKEMLAFLRCSQDRLMGRGAASRSVTSPLWSPTRQSPDTWSDSSACDPGPPWQRMKPPQVPCMCVCVHVRVCTRMLSSRMAPKGPGRPDGTWRQAATQAVSASAGMTMVPSLWVQRVLWAAPGDGGAPGPAWTTALGGPPQPDPVAALAGPAGHAEEGHSRQRGQCCLSSRMTTTRSGRQRGSCSDG